MAINVETPIGPVHVTADTHGISALGWGAAPHEEPNDVLEQARDQLRAYFLGNLHDFDLPLSIDGSAFTRDFARALCAIPAGETRSYGDLARDLSVSAQAIGQACGANRIPIIVPCHRVLGANGLGGYSGDGGVETKVWLLKHENAGGLLI